MRGGFGGILAGAIGLAAVFLGGCSPSTPTPSAPPPIVQAIPDGPPPPAGVIAGPLGSSLTEADRQTASDAQIAALDKGEKRSWKGKSAVFGYVEPGAENGGCRDYTHTVFIDGRPQSGKGSACRQSNGTWKF
jgi:surface antigen